MMKKSDKDLIVALDVGTSKVAALICEVGEDGSLEVIAMGSHASLGLKKGVVVNIESTVQSIQRAVEEAELMADCEVHGVFTGIAASHVRSQNSHGMVAVRDGCEVTQADVDQVVEAARAVPLAADQKVLHIIPQEYVIDNQEGMRDPVGMCGVRLETRVHMVTCAQSAVQNIERCITRCGLNADAMILGPLASSEAVLSDDEKELGVCLVDIGAGTTDIAVFTNGAIRHTAVIPIAGDQVTNDIAVALRTPTQHAECIKLDQGCAQVSRADPEAVFQVPSIGDRDSREMSRRTLAEVIEARVEELLTLVKSELRRSGFEDLTAAGVVLTGGTAKLDGMLELSERVFEVPVRLGLPQGIGGLQEVVEDPIYSTSVGLLLYGYQNREARVADLVARGRVTGAWQRMRGWFKGNF